MPRKKIVLTGGGTAGHVIPHIAMFKHFQKENWTVLYVGSKGIEKSLAEKHSISFETISSGKLRRYFSWQNFSDIFKTLLGILQSGMILFAFRPQVVFSKGGFVSVPVAIAAWILRIPVVTHESDATPGLANKIIMKFSKKILYSFPETLKHLPPAKAVFSGTPVRDEIFLGNRSKALQLCQFDPTDSRPVVLVIGGSLGAERINKALISALPELLKTYRVIHLTGKGKSEDFSDPGYKSFEFLGDELKDIFALCDLVIARAGANSIFEFLYLKKPMLLIPLEIGSRGDQVVNAEIFVNHGWALILSEKQLTPSQLLTSLNYLAERSPQLKLAMKDLDPSQPSQVIMSVLKDYM